MSLIQHSQRQITSINVKTSSYIDNKTNANSSTDTSIIEEQNPSLNEANKRKACNEANQNLLSVSDDCREKQSAHLI